MTQPHQTRKYLQSSGYGSKVFQTRLLQLQATVKRLLFDLNLVLLCVLFLIVFMKVPSQHSNNVIYCIKWLSNAFLVQCFKNFLRGDMPPDPPSIASQLCRSHSGHGPQTALADIFKTYLPIGRLFSFSKCNSATVKRGS